MNKRDLVFLLSGLVIAGVGIGAVFYGGSVVVFIALFLLSILILVVLLLQRRQLAAVQKRTLEIIRAYNAITRNPAKNQPQGKVLTNSRAQDFSTKKIIGLLTAQQTSMEILNKKIENLDSRKNSEK